MGKWTETKEAYHGKEFSAQQGVEIGKAAADGMKAGISVNIPLSTKEVEILKSCIYMSAAEGFYQLARDNLDVSEDDIKSILVSLGLSRADAEDFLERAQSF